MKNIRRFWSRSAVKTKILVLNTKYITLALKSEFRHYYNEMKFILNCGKFSLKGFDLNSMYAFTH